MASVHMNALSKEILEGEKEVHDLDCDMYGLTVLVIAKDLADIIHAAKSFQCVQLFHYVRLSFGAACQALNIWLQLILLVYVHRYVMDPAVHTVQAHYKQYHREVFDPDGSFRIDIWHTWTGPWLNLCRSSMTKMTFTSTVMILWSTRMLGEIRGAWRLHRRIFNMPAQPPGVQVTDMVQERRTHSGKEEFEIVFLNTSTRVFLWVFCVLPKMVVGIYLWGVGCQWLNATESFDDLILNALALEFIISIDETILVNFFPESIQKDIAATKFTYPKQENEQEAHDHTAVVDYIRSMFFAAFVLSWAYLYLHYFQAVLPDFKEDIDKHCVGDWFTGKFIPLCGPFQEGCFPFGASDGEPLPLNTLAGSSLPDLGYRRLLQAVQENFTAAGVLAEIALLPTLV